MASYVGTSGVEGVAISVGSVGMRWPTSNAQPTRWERWAKEKFSPQHVVSVGRWGNFSSQRVGSVGRWSNFSSQRNFLSTILYSNMNMARKIHLESMKKR